MAAVLDFPDRPCEDPRRVAPRRPTGSQQEGECEIVIFPGIRRERHAAEPLRSGYKDGVS